MSNLSAVHGDHKFRQESLNRDGEQFHLYQQNERSPLTSNRSEDDTSTDVVTRLGHGLTIYRTLVEHANQYTTNTVF